MSNWKKILSSLANNVDETFDALNSRLSQRLGRDKKYSLLPYVGFGTDQKLFLRGRVFSSAPIADPTNKDDVWDNLLNSYRRVNSQEVAQAVVQIQTAGVTQTVQSDQEGYINAELSLPHPLEDGSSFWHTITWTLQEPSDDEPTTATQSLLIPTANAQFGLISDIDDTVLQSSATNYFKAAKLMFLQNARTRLPFAGVAALYQALHQGKNPLFYVSSSPWNLYDLLTDFFAFQKLPLGPLFLQDYGFSADQFLLSGHGQHKLTQIARIMNTYPSLSFILLGDSGQKDPEIYHEVVKQYPGRVLAVYIRDVSGDTRDTEVEKIAQEVTQLGVPMLLAADSFAVAEHAHQLQLLPAEALEAIRQATYQDQSDPSELEQLLDEA